MNSNDPRFTSVHYTARVNEFLQSFHNISLTEFEKQKIVTRCFNNCVYALVCSDMVIRYRAAKEFGDQP